MTSNKANNNFWLHERQCMVVGGGASAKADSDSNDRNWQSSGGSSKTYIFSVDPNKITHSNIITGSIIDSENFFSSSSWWHLVVIGGCYDLI